MLRLLIVMSCALALGCDGGDSKPDPKTKAQSKLPPPKEGAGRNALDAIASAPVALKPRLAAQALRELEFERLPKGFLELLDASDVEPEQRAMVLAKNISENISVLDRACEADAEELMKAMSTVAPDARDAMLWDGCKFERQGLIAKSERPQLDPMMAIVAHMVFTQLKDGGEVTEPETQLLKLMMRRTDDGA